MAVRILNRAVERVGETERARRRHLARHQKRRRGNRRQRAAHRALLKPSLDRRDRRKQLLRVGEQPGARSRRRDEQLPDARSEPIGEHAVAAANDAARRIRVRRAGARLHVVEIFLRDVLRRVLFEVVSQAVGHRQLVRGLPVILEEHAERAVIHVESRPIVPSRRHIVGPRRAHAGIARRGDEVRPPEHRRREALKRRERRKDEAGGKEQIELGLIVNDVDVDARLRLMTAGAQREAVGALNARLAVVVDVRCALAHDDEVGQVERRFLQHRGEVERAPRRLKPRFVDEPR